MGDRLTRPVFVVGSPRSGTTLLQNVLCRDPSVYRLGRESRFLWHRLGAQEVTGRFPGRESVAQAYLSELFLEGRPWTRAEERRWALRCASQGTPVQYLDLPHDLLEELVEPGSEGPFAGTEQAETAPFTLPPQDATYATETVGEVRMVDKDTGHCWRLPHLAAEFPDASFVFVVRDPLAAVRSLVAGWRHPTWFFTYRMAEELRIGGYSDHAPWGRRWWNFNLFPGYADFLDAPIERLCTEQWAAAIRPMVEHGAPLVAEGRGMFVSFEALVAQPMSVLTQIAEFAGLDAAEVTAGGLGKTYMSMVPSTWDPRDSGLLEIAGQARAELQPIVHLLGQS